ncbi:hypothetical protein OAP76_04490 [Alphaproteobacteria bacterium]|nr:hypothetical protein [Alphaproteobacteria bacterium]
MKLIFKILSLIISIGVALSANTAFAAKETSLLLALKIECSGNNAGGNSWSDNFFGFSTEHSFHASRWWFGSGDELGKTGQHTFNGSRTKKSLLIKGEGIWLEERNKKPYKMQFVSKGDKPLIKHLEGGIDGFGGDGKYRRECSIKLLNKVEANDAIQLGSYTRVITGLRNKIDNINTRKKEEEENYNQLVKINEDTNEEINTLQVEISALSKEITTLENIVSSLNEEVNLAKNNSEFELKYEEILKQFEDVNIKLENSKSDNENLEKQLSSLKKSEIKINTSLDNKTNEIASLENLNLELKQEIEIYRQKEKELIQIIEIAEQQSLQEEKIDEEKKRAEERKIEKERIAKEEKLKEQQEAERQAQEEINKKLSLLTQETDLEKAQNFLTNLESFIREYPNEFDIITISEYFIATRSILDGILNFTNETKLQEFRDYVSEESELYLNYSKEISQQNQIEKLNTINAAILGLDASINELKLVMANNTQSVNLQKWTDAIKIAEITLKELNSYDELIDANKDINDLIKLKVEVDESIVLLNETKDELKIYLQENLTTDLAPSILDQIKLIDEAVKNENIEKIIDTNQKSKEFILKKIKEPEEQIKAVEIENERKKLVEEQNKEFEEIFDKYKAKNDYQKQIVKLLYFLEVPFENIAFSNMDNVISISGIGDESIRLDELKITKINKKYLNEWFQLNEKYKLFSDVSNSNFEIPELKYLGKIADDVKFSGLNIYDLMGYAELRIEEVGIKNLDFENFDKIKNILSSSVGRGEEHEVLSLILSAKFDKIYFNNSSLSEPEPASLKYFEITNWNEFSFKKIEIKDYKLQEEFNEFHLENFKISNFALDNNFTYDLLGSPESQELLLSGDYSEIFNSFVSLDNLEIKNFSAKINNEDAFILDNAKINNIKFDYFGANNNIKVPTSFNFEIKGADFNYNQVREISGGLAILDGLIDELGYEKIKFDFKTGWKWNTQTNNISFDLDLGITDAASLAISTNLIDLDTNILTLQGVPLLTYLMTAPKLKELSISLVDRSFRDKFINYAAKEQGMTSDQLKDFTMQSMDIYTNTLGIDQGLVKQLIDSTSNFINGSNKIVFSIKPPEPVSINSLTPDVMEQNYEGLVDKLNIRVGNF